MPARVHGAAVAALALGRRLLWGLAIVVLTALTAYGGGRLLRPDLNPGEPLLAGTAEDLRQVFLHGDLGVGCEPGCAPLERALREGWPADLLLLAGGVLLGVALGYFAGVWCAARRRSAAARAVEAAGAVFLVAPVYIVGLSALLLLEPSFGLIQLGPPLEIPAYVSPGRDLLRFVHAMAVPWLVLAAPIAAVCLRLTVAAVVDVLEEDYVRTAFAKGLPRGRAVRRHAATAARTPVASYVAVALPVLVSNLVIVEIVFDVPGAFRELRGAVINTNFPLLQALAVYASLYTVGLTMLSDLAVRVLDPVGRRDSRPVA